MSNDHIGNIKILLSKNGFDDKYQIIPLPQSGSNRQYYRINFTKLSNQKTLIASFNNDVSENIANNSFTQHFKSLGFKVPEIMARDNSYKYFLIQDLGDNTLFNLLNESNDHTKILKEVISDLVKFQVEGIKKLDLEVAYPVKDFNYRSLLWDLNYFKYYFVKPHDIDFNENYLEDDFNMLANKLLKSECSYFNYRDFQSRNIMISNNEPWYIDFQGGRRGPLQYDLISFLYQVKANLNDETRKILYSHYIKELNRIIPGKQEMFEKYYQYFRYFRLMQVMGAYGFRGIIQRKSHFLQSIPKAIISLSKLIMESPITNEFPELSRIFNQILNIDYNIPDEDINKLTISISSFSYKKKGIPIDVSGNGGGHVFDCRSLPNPGRLDTLRDFTGKDEPVINYLANQNEMTSFINNTKRIIDQSINNYLERNFNNLQINFGCTGGRHRSVYSASLTADYVRDTYPETKVLLVHNELD
jgi:aminoglycoside/choline kinase family phosphotransferase